LNPLVSVGACALRPFAISKLEKQMADYKRSQELGIGED